MAALLTLIPLVLAPMNQGMLLLTAPRTTESLRPASCLKGCLALLLSAVELQELGQGHSRLKLDSIHSHDASLWHTSASLALSGAAAELAT